MPLTVKIENLISDQSNYMVGEMQKISSWANSEEDVRYECNKLIDKFLKKAGIHIKGRHEYGLFGGRVDSKYGGVIIEYKYPKGPDKLTQKKDSHGNKALIKQLKKRFKDFQRIEHIESNRLFAVGLDSNRLLFMRYRNGRYQTEYPQQINKYAVERLLRALISLGAQGNSYTPDALADDFGSNSSVAQKGIHNLYKVIEKTKDKKALTFFNQWKILFSEVCDYDIKSPNKKILKLAEHYSILKAQPAELLFSIHTYYAIFMKFLAAEIVQTFSPIGVPIVNKCVSTTSSKSLRKEMEDLEAGSIWMHLGITNFLEGDLFSWYTSAWNDEIADVIWEIVKALDNYDPSTLSVDPLESQDLLKNLYQELFPKTVRHDLGEYYTPDWLAQHVLKDIGYDGDPDKRMLDPACGSGTFLVSAINYVKSWYDQNRDQCGISERQLLDKIIGNIIGFDLNPLAVMAARTNYLLAIRDMLKYATKIEIPVYLCDSIMTPEIIGSQQSQISFLTESGTHYDHLNPPLALKTSAGTFLIPSDIARSRKRLGTYASIIESCVKNKYTTNDFLSRCKEEDLPIADEHLHRDLFNKLVVLDSNNQNGIWARIIKNAFAPLFVNKVDYIIGNPPWVNWNNLPNEYRLNTSDIWKRYNLWPKYLMGASSDFSKLFFYSSIDNYLKNNGKIGFVITQSVFKTTGGDLFRSMKLPDGANIRILKVDDMVKLNPFRGASNRTAVIFAERDRPTKYPVEYIRWIPQEGYSRDLANIENVKKVTNSIKEEAIPIPPNTNGPWFTGTPKEHKIIDRLIGKNSLKPKMGIHTYGANSVYFVERLVEKDISVIIANIVKGAKYKVEEVQVDCEKEVIYPLLRGRDIEPFYATTKQAIVFPYQSSGKLLSEETLKKEFPLLYGYLFRFKDILSKRSQFKRTSSSAKWYQLFAVYDSTLSPFKVVWKEQSSQMSAAVVSVEDEKIVIPDHKVMFIPFKRIGEAHYICAILNSTLARILIKGSSIETQLSTKVIQALSIPRYSHRNKIHASLSKLSKDLHEAKAQNQEGKIELLKKRLDLQASLLWEIPEKELQEINFA